MLKNEEKVCRRFLFKAGRKCYFIKNERHRYIFLLMIMRKKKFFCSIFWIRYVWGRIISRIIHFVLLLATLLKFIWSNLAENTSFSIKFTVVCIFFYLAAINLTIRNSFSNYTCLDFESNFFILPQGLRHFCDQVYKLRAYVLLEYFINPIYMFSRLPSWNSAGSFQNMN